MTVVGVEKDEARLRLTVVAELAAPIERAWELWADPRQLERWWGPPSHPATVLEHRLAPGATVRYELRGAEGVVSRGWWRIETVDPPRSLTFTDGWSAEDGTPDLERPTLAVAVRLAARDGTTRMELRFAFASREHMEQMERWGAFDVLRSSVAQMDALVAG